MKSQMRAESNTVVPQLPVDILKYFFINKLLKKLIKNIEFIISKIIQI